MHRRIERFARALDAPSLDLVGPVEIDEVYVSAGKKGRERDRESLTVYTDDFRAYEPLEDDDAFDREYVVHGDGEYADDEVHVNTCESHASQVRRWLSPHQGISKDKLTQYLRALQLRRELFRKPGRDAFKHAVQATL